MILLTEQLVEKVNAFPAEQQQEILRYAEFLEMKLNTDVSYSQLLQDPKLSMAGAMSKCAGCLDGGPSDLSTNKAHMKG